MIVDAFVSNPPCSVYNHCAQVSADFKSRQDGQAAAARLLAVIDAPLDDTDYLNDKGDKPDSFSGQVSFESCSFAYPSRPNNPVFYKSDELDGLSLSIAAKESVAFVGMSGCGKSTVQQLVLRFYEVTGGSVLVDDHNVQALNISWLRDKIGYVGQQPVLFAGTVKENLLLGKPDATEEELIAASRSANAHGFIEGLEFGYDTEIGSGGSLLSGGQKQRIAIARAIIKNPKILVLDEATSALDNESQRIVQAALDELQRKQPRTTLTVAHRLATIKNCDKIAVLGGGGVQECAPHNELIKNHQGLYYRLWKAQGATAEEDKRASMLKKNL